MRPIPPKLREELASLPRMKRCACAELGGCSGRIEWHHVWIYAGRQINELWAIVGACNKHHEMVGTEPIVKKAFEVYSLQLATAADLAKYPRKPWGHIIKSYETS